MTAQQFNEASRAVQQAADILASLEFIDQKDAQHICKLSEAVMNMFTIVYYQAETGLATQEDFKTAVGMLRQACS